MSDSARRPLRPSIPALFWLAVGVWVGVWCAEGLAWQAPGSAIVPSLVLSGVIALAAWAMGRVRWIAVVSIGLAAGLAAGTLFWGGLARQSRDVETLGGGELVGEVVTDATAGAYGSRSRVRLRSGAPGACLEVLWPRGRVPRAGETVTLTGRVRAPGTDEWARKRHRAGVAASVTAKVTRVGGWARSLRGVIGPWRQRGVARIGRIPGDGSALAAGVVLGSRQAMAGTRAESDFRVTGLTHLVAVSGSHLVVVAALVSWCLASRPVAAHGRCPDDGRSGGALRGRNRRSAVCRSSVADGNGRLRSSCGRTKDRLRRGARSGGLHRARGESARRVRPGVPTLGGGSRRTGDVHAFGGRMDHGRAPRSVPGLSQVRWRSPSRPKLRPRL